MNINIGSKWIVYQSVEELKSLMELHYVRIGNDVSIGDNVRLGNYVTLGDNVRIGDNVRLDQSPLYIASALPFIFNGYNDRIQIGCKDFTVTEWIERYREIAIEAEITDESRIQKYYRLICFYDEWREK